MNYNEILKLPEGVHIVTVNTERCMVVRLQEGYPLTTMLPDRMMLIQHYSEKGHLLAEQRFENIFTADEKEKFLASCRMWSEALFSYEPFTSNAHRINIRAVWAPSNESGVSKPGTGEWVDNLFETRFYMLGSERYQMTEEFQKVRDVASNAPYESIFILTNTDKYGGGGIYNFYGLGSAGKTGRTGEVYVHEFGHSLMGLGDEYIEKGNTVSALYPAGKEPWEANLTRLVNFNGKWEDMIAEGTPTPTIAAEGSTEKDWVIGTYEGGGYLEKDIYRGWPECMMKALTDFCPVCQRAITRYLDYICK